MPSGNGFNFVARFFLSHGHMAATKIFKIPEPVLEDLEKRFDDCTERIKEARKVTKKKNEEIS